MPISEYETRRLDRIERNKALLAELDIKPIVPRTSSGNARAPPSKRRKISSGAAPQRTSARIAAAPSKPTYNDEPDIKAVTLPRSAPRKVTKMKPELGSTFKDETEPLVPVKDVDDIRAGWNAWQPTAPEPTRSADGRLHFEDYSDFTPNKTPEEMLREGCFGGSYYRPLKSRRLGIVIEDDWEEIPKSWITGLNADRFLKSPTYDPDVNKFKVACGQSIEEWEAAGWISHEHDVRGWFQWYTRFYRGRRCDDDGRQVGRWKKCVGVTGRWRRMLLKKYLQHGVKEVFDDGADEDAPEVSPVMHQTCHQWAYEVRQDDLDDAWAGR